MVVNIYFWTTYYNLIFLMSSLQNPCQDSVDGLKNKTLLNSEI